MLLMYNRKKFVANIWQKHSYNNLWEVSMYFFLFLIIFAGAFTFLIKDGANAKHLLAGCVVSLITMFALKASGKDLIPTLGVGLNMFLMTYDILALLAIKAPTSAAKKKGNIKPSNPEEIEVSNSATATETITETEKENATSTEPIMENIVEVNVDVEPELEIERTSETEREV